MTAEGGYLSWLFVTTGLLIGLVGAGNLLVDPYGALGSRRIVAFNFDKPDFVEQLRMTHVYAVERRKPRCILLGTSRAGRGLDPDSAALSSFDCYNMALPAINLYEMRRYFQHAQAIRPLERLILALDFRVFHTGRDRTGAFSEARLAVDADDRSQFNLFSARLPDLASALFSLRTAQLSVKTVRQQGWANDTLRANGFWAKTVSRYDYQAAFAAYSRDTVARFNEYRESEELVTSSLEELRKLLRAAIAADVEVTLMFSPSHAVHWQTLELAGLSSRWEDIKRNVVRINEEEAARAGRRAYAVWDFGGSYGPSLERVAASPAVSMTWYWESVHYKRALGELMLERMLRGSPLSDTADFGVQLTGDNLDVHLARLHDYQRQYAAAHPEVVSTLCSLIERGNAENLVGEHAAIRSACR